MQPDDIPIATSSSQPLPGHVDAALPSDHAFDVDVIGRRIFAFLLDVLMVTIVATAVSALLRLPITLESLLPFAGFLGYKIGAEALRGKTLGKRMLGISVTDRTGGPIGWLPSLIRNLMLIPGAFLLFIPTLAAMEYSATKQRIGDQMAGTLVVREPIGARVTSGIPAMVGQAMVPIAPGVAPVVMARSGRRADQWRWPIAGSIALAATTMIATVIFTIDTAICGQVNDRYCQDDFDAPVWSGSQTAHALAIVCATISLVALPFVIGFVIKKWVWTPISGGVWAGTFIAGVMLGLRLTRNVYASYYSESDADPYAVFVYLFFLGVGTLIPVICALLGILAGMGVDKLRA